MFYYSIKLFTGVSRCLRGGRIERHAWVACRAAPIKQKMRKLLSGLFVNVSFKLWIWSIHCRRRHRCRSSQNRIFHCDGIYYAVVDAIRLLRGRLISVLRAIGERSRYFTC
jgi:hypothetical protein